MTYKCNECLARSFFSEVFDVHWHGKEDCPVMECPYEEMEEQDG